jgi:hypothetical protein
MRSFVRFVLSLCLASVCSLGCTSIIGLKAPPQQDASTPTSDEGGTDATMQMMTPMPEGSVGDTALGEAANPQGSVNGVACAANGDCETGFCTDGVCCNNACAGTCEKCSLAGAVGTCSPIPANTDPEMECVPVVSDAGAAPVADASPTPVVDAGEAGAEDDASADGAGTASDANADASGDADAAGGDAGDGGAAPVINFPDGGYTSTASTCYGACDGNGGNGKGACVYPGTTKTCGTQFCNANDQAAGFACDGNGSCTLGLSSCTAYACASGACGKTCNGPTDCLQGYYCNAGMCQPTLGISEPCTVPSECTSGFCTRGVAGGQGGLVCCETACTIPGGNCVTSAALQGKCECNVTCPAGGSCQVYYQDLDGDGYGNKDGDPTGGITAYVGCSNVTPKAGYVADHTDCDDQDPNAHPGQTDYFTTPGRVNYDYDCDGTQEKQTPEYPGGTCKFCDSTTTCGATDTACTAAGDQAAFACGPRLERVCPPCKPPLLCVCRISFGGCYPNTTTAFAQTVPCGTSADTTTCGTCLGAGGGDGTGTANSYAAATQACH